MPLFFFTSHRAVSRLESAIRSISRQEMTEEAKEPKKDKRKTAGGLFIPAGLFIGMGIGWALGYLIQGMFIGLGGGFLLYGITMLTIRD